MPFRHPVKYVYIWHCEKRTQVTDAAIHRVSEDVGGVVCSITEGQWIATGCRPRDDKGITF